MPAAKLIGSDRVESRAAPEIKIARPDAGARPRLPALTTLRFFAALHVVLFHMKVVKILDGGPWWYQNFASIGYVGVNFFFVLSGFILVYTYAGPSLDPRQFWQARWARIYPAYVLSLIVAAPFFFFAVGHLDLPFFAWSKAHLAGACILTLGLMQAWIPQAALTWNPVCWSLSVEAFFYGLFPLLLPWGKRAPALRLVLWIMACWMISLSFSLAYILVHPDSLDQINSLATNLFWKNVLSFNPLVRLPEFLVGMLACRLFLSGRGERRLAAALVMSGLLGVAVVTLLAGWIPNPVISTGLLSPAFAAIIYGFALRPRWLSFLEARWLLRLGDASYSLYLLHSIILAKAFAALSNLPGWIRVAGSLGAAVGAALLSYDWIEEPARRVLRPHKRR